jgi:hypothetical protein
MELDFHLNTIQHLESRLSLHIDRRNHRRSRLAHRLAESQREDDEEEAIEDETEVVPNPDLPNSFLSVLELFNTPIYYESFQKKTFPSTTPPSVVRHYINRHATIFGSVMHKK